jgi:hypothetical protein
MSAERYRVVQDGAGPYRVVQGDAWLLFQGMEFTDLRGCACGMRPPIRTNEDIPLSPIYRETLRKKGN